jgi:hypothetical protein
VRFRAPHLRGRPSSPSRPLGSALDPRTAPIGERTKLHRRANAGFEHDRRRGFVQQVVSGHRRPRLDPQTDAVATIPGPPVTGTPDTTRFVRLRETNYMTTTSTAFDGGCTCRHVRYRMTARPLIVHCCHCRWCQRETGASFALNAVIEADAVQLLHGDVEVVVTPSSSGKGQKIARCPKCRIALWSNYAQAGPAIRFVRVGTLDEPDTFAPDIHIYTSTKQPWVVIPSGTPSVPEFYSPREVWSAENLERFARARSKADRP